MPDPARVIGEMVEAFYQNDRQEILRLVNTSGHIGVFGEAMESLLRQVYQLGLGRGIQSAAAFTGEVGSLVRLNSR